MNYAGFQSLTVELMDGVAHVIIDNPPINLFDLVLYPEFAKLTSQLRDDDDVRADTDMNVVMTGSGAFVEVQGTAEREPFDRGLLNELLDLATIGCVELTAKQKAALATPLSPKK